MSAKAPQTPARATDSRPSLAFLPVPLLFLAVPLRALDSLFVWTDHGEIVMGLMIRPLETWPRILSEPMVVGFDEAGVEAPRCSRPLQVIAMYCGVNLELGYPEDSLDYFDRLTAGNPLLESSPAVAHCGAMSLLETGSWQRAVPVLEALYRQGGVGMRRTRLRSKLHLRSPAPDVAKMRAPGWYGSAIYQPIRRSPTRSRAHGRSWKRTPAIESSRGRVVAVVSGSRVDQGLFARRHLAVRRDGIEL